MVATLRWLVQTCLCAIATSDLWWLLLKFSMVNEQDNAFNHFVNWLWCFLVSFAWLVIFWLQWKYVRYSVTDMETNIFAFICKLRIEGQLTYHYGNNNTVMNIHWVSELFMRAELVWRTPYFFFFINISVQYNLFVDLPFGQWWVMNHENWSVWSIGIILQCQLRVSHI